MLATARAAVDWLGLIEDCHRRYGDSFRLSLPHLGRVVVVTRPATIKALYEARDGAAVGPARGAATDLLTPGTLPLLDGAAHLARRRLMLPPLHGRHLASYPEEIAAAVDEHTSRWQAGGAVKILHFAERLTTDLMGRALLDLKDPALAARFRSLMPRYVPAWSRTIVLPSRAKSERMPGPWRDYVRIKRGLQDIFSTEIAARRAAPTLEGRADMCSLLVSGTDEHGEGLSDEQISNELLSTAMAGSHTTGIGLAWALDYVLHDAPVLRQIQDGDDSEPLLDAVVQEALRLRPPVEFAPRQVNEPLELGDGLWLGPGEVALPSFHLVHRRPDLYERPDEFRPQRFLEARPVTYGWLPFGGGAHRCIGASFAQLEMRQILSEILRRWHLQPVRREVSRARRRHLAFWAPAGGVPVRVQAARSLASEHRRTVGAMP